MAKSASKKGAAATIGVDFGTSTTQVSFLPSPGNPDLFRIGQGPGYDAYSVRSLIAVHPDSGEIRVGSEAASARRPWVVLPSLKRCLRCTLDKETGRGACTNPPNRSICLGLARYKIGRQTWSVDDLIRAFIAEVAKRTPVGGPVTELRFSVPPLYEATEIAIVRDAVAQAYEAASVADVRFEPTSALMAINEDKQLAKGLHVVVDIGGGTTDVATLELRVDYVEIHEPRSAMIAGDDFDNALFEHFRALVPAEGATDYELREACRVAKEQLSRHQETEVLGHRLTRAEFESIVGHIARRLVAFVVEYTKERLEEFKRVGPVKVLRFHLAGGASRISLISDLLGSVEFPATRIRVEVVTGSGISDVRREHLAVFCVALGNMLEKSDVNLSSLPYALKIYDGNRLVRTIEANSRFPVRFHVAYEGRLRIIAERGREKLDVVAGAVPTVPPFMTSRVSFSRRVPLQSLIADGRGATFHITNGALMFVQGIRRDRWYEAPWKNLVDEDKRRARARTARRDLGLS